MPKSWLTPPNGSDNGIEVTFTPSQLTAYLAALESEAAL